MPPASTKKPDPEAYILQVLNILHEDGDVFELCAIKPHQPKSHLWKGFAAGKDDKSVVAGWFNDKKKAAALARQLNDLGAEGIYVTLNPCNKALRGRADNKLFAGVARTPDKQVVHLRWFLIDIDVESKPKGVSANEEEHGFAIDHAKKIREILTQRGWPTPMLSDSGNGAHLLYRINLENNDTNVAILKSTLNAMNDLFCIRKDDITLTVDTTVYNPARICKLYGTWVRKGDNTEQMPHRTSKVLEGVKNFESASIELFEAIIADAAKEEEKKPKSPTAEDAKKKSSAGGTFSKFDLAAYLNQYNVDVKEVKAHGESELHILNACIFDPSHSGGEASIGRTSEGKLFYQCFHDSCKKRTWADARKLISGEEKLVSFSPESLEAQIDEMNKTFAMIMVGSKCCILHEFIDPVTKREDIDFWTVPDFHHKNANKLIWMPDGTGNTKEYSVSRLWYKSKARREFDGIIFAPGQDIQGYYNMFKGFAVNPVPGRWALFKRHIDMVISGGDKAISKYILAWISHLLQQPGGERPGTAIVLRGKQGTGKGFFVSQLGAILGHHYLHITQASHLTGKFNSQLKAALLVFVDEALWAGDKQGESVLKGIVTEDTLIIEHKGKDAVKMKNHVSLIIASNNEWVVPAGLEERRFLVLDVDEGHMQDKEYFQALSDEMNNGGREAMLHDLLQANINGFDLRTIPRTDALFQQACYSMSGVQKFWLEVLMRGTLSVDHREWEGVIQTSKLYFEYIEFCKSINDRYPLANNMFTKQLKKLNPPGSLKRGQKTCHYREGDGYISKVEWCLWFDELQPCRAEFDKLLGRCINWKSEILEEDAEKDLAARKRKQAKEEEQAKEKT